MSGLSWKSSPCKDFFLKYITIIFQSFNCFLFLHICCFRINIHRCFNICMTHNTLNHFQISFIFTKSGAKCVSDMMTRKMRNQYRASALPFCLNNFFGIVGFVNSFDCTVDYAGFMDNSVFIAKDKPTHTINHLHIKTGFFLCFVFILDSRKRDEDTTSRIAANP